MSDFPQPHVLPLSVHSLSTYATTFEAMAMATTTIASYNWPAEKQAVYVPVTIPWPYPVHRVFWANGSAVGGNVDLGIYTPGGARIYHTGATAQSGVSSLQYVAPTPFLLSPGSYYFALSNDSATTTNRAYGGSVVGTNEGRVAGMLQQASAEPLPESATFAAWASTGLPLCGVCRTPSGF